MTEATLESSAEVRTAVNSDNDRERKEVADGDGCDDEGLRRHYSVVLCGTGLVQSILASALARCKVSVLHVDGADYYGGLEAVWTLPYVVSLNDAHPLNGNADATEANPQPSGPDDTSSTVISLYSKGALASLRFHSVQRKKSFPVAVNTIVHTPYGKGKVMALKAAQDGDVAMIRMIIQLTGWKLANDSFPTIYTWIPFDKNSDTKNVVQDGAADYLWRTHRIRTPTAETAAAVLDRQSRSIALDVTPYLLYASGPAVNGLLSSSVSDYVEFKSLEGLLYMDDANKLSRVPCSKNDVFASKMLSPLDKRRLMKFLQTAMDYATAVSLQGQQHEDDQDTVDELQSWNEQHLNQGRSLPRPQNKAVASTDLLQLQDQCRAESDSRFESYLKENQKLSPALIKLVRYALALEADESSSSTAAGMKQLCAHMLALGRFGATAFLVPIYGSGELAQAFCRSAAVYGATYLLRRAPTGIVVNNNENVVQGIHLNGPQGEPPATAAKCIACTHVVVPDGAVVQAQSTGRRILRRISILCGKPLLTDDKEQQPQRHVVILPPLTVRNQTSAIHGLLLDETVNVSPHVPGGCTVLHLTTTVETSDDDNFDDSVLEEAQKVILRSCKGKDSDVTAVDDIFHVTFSYDLLMPTDCTKIDGMHVIRRPRPALSADTAFEQAAEIFAKICPGQEFLKMSQEMGDAVKATLGENALDEDDEEKTVLETAVGMIDPP